MEDYVAKVVIIEGDDTSCTFSWSCSFEPHEDAADELTKNLKDMFNSGMDRLEALVTSSS